MRTVLTSVKTSEWGQKWVVPLFGDNHYERQDHDHNHEVEVDTASVLDCDELAIINATKEKVVALEKSRDGLDDRLRNLTEAWNANDLIKSFDEMRSRIAASLAAEQSSHRRFEQLVQTLLAAHSEVKELYDTIGGAIKKATESSSTGAIKLIEDKGRVVTSSVEALFKERTARIEADLPKMVESVFKDVFDKLRTQYVAETEKMSANASAELEEKVSGQLDLIEKRGGEILAAMSQAAVSQQTGIRDLVAKGSSDLHADLDAEIPSLFRSSGGKTTFGQRLKWLLLGKV